MRMSRRMFTRSLLGASVALLVPGKQKAEASEYTSTLSFSREFAGAAYYFNGSHINITMDTRYSNYSRLYSSFQVTLQRRTWYGTWVSIGTANLPREGRGYANWTNVGPGTYRFYFSKAYDGITITSSNVRMFN